MKVVAKKYFSLTGVLSGGSYSEIITPDIFTSTEGGDFLISVSDAASEAGGGTTSAAFSWTDATFGAQSVSFSDSATGQPLAASFPVHLEVGGTISSELQVNSPAPIAANVYVIVSDLAAPGL